MAAPINLPKPFALLLLLFFLCQICRADNCRNVLFSGQPLGKGQTLKNGDYSLKFQDDCRLVLYDAGTQVWQSNDPVKEKYRIKSCGCKLNYHGNLYIDSVTGPIWLAFRSSQKRGHYVLVLQNDRNLVIYGPNIWSVPDPYYRLGQMNVTNMIADDADNKGCVLYTFQKLNAGESLRAGNYALVMQSDCDLVLFEGDKPIWSTKTGGLSQYCYLKLRNDGNLVVYRHDFKELWTAFNTRKDYGNYLLVLQKEGRLVLYGTPLWSLVSQDANAMPTINVNNTSTGTISTANEVAAVL